MTDFANLVLAVDATSVNAGAEALDRLSAAGTRASGASGGFSNATRATGVAAAKMATEAQALTVATVGAATGFKSAGMMANNARIAMLDMTHVGINMTQMLASGVDPMRALVMESGRLATAVQYSAGGIGGLVRQTAEWLGIIKVTRDAELAETAAMAASSAASIGAMAGRAAGAIAAADTELALAEASLRVAATAEAEAAAQTAIASAHRKVALAAAEATVAENALAVAQGRAAETAAASSLKTVTSIGRVGLILGGVGIAAGIALAGIKVFQNEVSKSGVLDKYAQGLRLTDEQIKKAGGSIKYLADGTRQISGLTVSFGNIAQATFQVLAERAGFSGATIKSAFGSAFKWLADFGKFTIAILIAGFAGLIELVISLGANLGRLATGNFAALTNPLEDVSKQIHKTFDDVNAGFDKIGARSIKLQEQDYDALSDANKPKKGPKAPKGPGDHGLADALAELDAQIKGQWALAEAYQLSDSAAIKAEAHQKAEEQAIRHKGDVGLFYEKELRLAVAQRAADGAKTIADIHAQAQAQAVVNGLVEDGIIPVQRMGQALEVRGKQRELLAALAVAEEQGWIEQARKLRDEIDNVATAQDYLNDGLATEAALKAVAGKDDEIAKLQLETKMISASNRERAVRLAQLDAENFIRDNGVTDPTDKATILKKYADAADAAATLTQNQNNYNSALSYTADLLGLINDQAQAAAGSLAEAFGNVGAGIGTALTALTSYAATQAKLDEEHRASVKAAGDDASALTNVEVLYAKKSGAAKEQATLQAVHGIKTIFKEHSAAYKAISAVEKAYALFQAAETIASIVRDTTKTASSLANSAVRTTANTGEGASKIFADLGPWGFPVVAAMIAVLAALGASAGGGGGSGPSIPTAQDLQARQGTGTVLGSPDEKSNSIANALELMSKNSTKGLAQGSDMVRTLRNIQDGIGALTAALARSLNLSGGFFDTTGKLGTKSSGIQGFFGSTTTKSLYDQGIKLNAGSLSDILANGFSGATYQVIEKIKKSSGFLGIGGSTKTSYKTSTGALDNDITTQFGLITADLYKSIVDAAKILGFNVEDALKQFQVDIGQISFKDLSGSEINAQLEAVFSKLGDQMAGFAVAGLAGFQQAGEGLYETLLRLAKDFLTVGTALKSIGLVAPASIEAREALIKLSGGLDEFVSQANYYYDNFLSATEQQAFLQDQVNTAFAGLSLAVPSTIDQFKALVNAQDLTTESGQATYAALMAIAPAFHEVETAATQAAAAAASLAKQRTQLEIDLLNAQGRTVEAVAKKRQMELAAMDESLRGLQQQVWAAQDLSKAKDNLLGAYKRESQELETTINKFHGFATNLREFRDSLTDTGGANSYQRSLVNLLKQSGLANAGDEGALGGGLKGAAQSFLEVATANAGSLEDVRRAQALVARSIDSAIGTADSKASIAEQQLAQMKTQVSALVDINESVLSVAQAIADLKALAPISGTATAPATSGLASSGASGPNAKLDQTRHDEVIAALGNIAVSTDQATVSSNQAARVLNRWDRGGSLAVVTDADTPLGTKVAVP